MYTYTKKKNSLRLPQELQNILDSLITIGAKPILVGGCVRDHFLQLPIKDFDIEVYNIADFETLASHLKPFGSVKLVGKSFGVLKLHTTLDEYDFALPRLEKKVSSGHRGFEVTTNPLLEFKEAALRRDFTINAIGYDYEKRHFLDPYDGIEDIELKTLKHINDTTFVEDPLRVYRAVQFAARFEFTLSNTTFELCKSMAKEEEFKTIAKERIFDEFKKFLLKADKPSFAFELLKKLEIISHFPELEVLIGCEQEPEYHPEGDVWVHTLMCIDEMAKLRSDDEYQNLVLILAELCHDLGKPATTVVRDGKITSYNHEKEGVAPTKTFLSRLTNEKKLIDDIIPLVQYHLAPFQLYLQNSSQKAVKRLAIKVNIEQLCLVALADCKGRTIPDKSKCDQAIQWLLEQAKELNVQNEPLKPLVQGRDLISLGMKPSKAFKEILDTAYEIQLENENYTKNQIIDEIKTMLK